MKTICIIHGSAIVQAGLSEIIRRRLKCDVIHCNDLSEYDESVDHVVLIDEVVMRIHIRIEHDSTLGERELAQ